MEAESTAGRTPPASPVNMTGHCHNITVNEDGEEVRCNAECSPSSQLCHDCRQQSLHAFWGDEHAL